VSNIFESVSDTEVWSAALNGRADGFVEIFDRHEARVRRQAERLVATDADVDDVVAITFFEAWRHRATVRFVDESLLPWLLVVATNTSRNLTRASRRYGSMLAKLPAVESHADSVKELDDGDAAQALRRLPLADQRLITLCVLYDYPPADAARLLGITLTATRSRLTRAKARLASEYRTSLFSSEPVSSELEGRLP
jgi:RNA polymerase sigma factor (sigma-70 family)